VWLLKKVGIQKISTKFNPFWRDIFLNWSTILEGEDVNDATNVKCQPIWLNPSIKINGKVVLNEKQSPFFMIIHDSLSFDFVTFIIPEESKKKFFECL
jgi:hypothetical protein